MAASFSVLLITVPPGGLAADGGGAFVKIDGKESLLRAVELFLNRDNVRQIQIVFTAEAMEEAKRKYAAHLSFSGVKVLSGGPKWMDQVAAASGKISDEATHVVVHDAARPAVPYSDIDELLEAAEKHAAAALVAPLRAPLVEVDEGGNPLAFESAARFQQLLTPQVFSKTRFEEMARTKKEAHASELALVKGSGLNVRINSAGDASLVKAMMNLLPRPKIKGPTNPFEEAQW